MIVCVTARMGSSKVTLKASHPCFVGQKLQTTGFIVQALLIKHGLNSFANRLWLSRWEDIVDLKFDAFLDGSAVVCHSSACTHCSSGLTTAACYSATRTCRHSRRQDGGMSAEIQRLHDACECNKSHPSSSCNLLHSKMYTTGGAVPPVEGMCMKTAGPEAESSQETAEHAHIHIKSAVLTWVNSSRCLIALTRLQSEIVLHGSGGAPARLAANKLWVNASRSVSNLEVAASLGAYRCLLISLRNCLSCF